MQIWTTFYNTHVFKKWGDMYPQTLPWLRQCTLVTTSVLSMSALYTVSQTKFSRIECIKL